MGTEQDIQEQQSQHLLVRSCCHIPSLRHCSTAWGASAQLLLTCFSSPWMGSDAATREPAGESALSDAGHTYCITGMESGQEVKAHRSTEDAPSCPHYRQNPKAQHTTPSRTALCSSPKPAFSLTLKAVSFSFCSSFSSFALPSSPPQLASSSSHSAAYFQAHPCCPPLYSLHSACSGLSD